MSGKLPMGIAYPPRPLAEPRSGRYAGCESAAGEVFGCIPHGARAWREMDFFTMGTDPRILWDLGPIVFPHHVAASVAMEIWRCLI